MSILALWLARSTRWTWTSPSWPSLRLWPLTRRRSYTRVSVATGRHWSCVPPSWDRSWPWQLYSLRWALQQSRSLECHFWFLWRGAKQCPRFQSTCTKSVWTIREAALEESAKWHTWQTSRVRALPLPSFRSTQGLQAIPSSWMTPTLISRRYYLHYSRLSTLR